MSSSRKLKIIFCPNGMSTLSERIYRITKRHPTFVNKGKLAEALGLSRSMLYNYEQGNPPPPKEFLDKLISLEVSLDIRDGEESPNVQEESTPNVGKRVPVVGWAHAGLAATYEEMPHGWRQYIATDCRDPRAFGVVLEGDSMMPQFQDGDLLTLMPSEEPYNGCLAVCRFVDDGVLFRRMEFIGNQVRLMPLNERYEASTHLREEFSWIYPIFESRRLFWKKTNLTAL